MYERIPWPEEQSGFIPIKREEFQNYITEELCQYFLMWKRIKKYGWPQGRGYLCEPRKVFEIVELFDNENDSFIAFQKRQEK